MNFDEVGVVELMAKGETHVRGLLGNKHVSGTLYVNALEAQRRFEAQRHSELTSPDKVARRLAWLGIAIAAVALLNDFGVFSSREKPATPPPSQSQSHSPTSYPAEPTPVYLPSKAMGSALPATTQPTTSLPTLLPEPKADIPSTPQE